MYPSSASSSRPPGCGKIAMSGAWPELVRSRIVFVKSWSAVYWIVMPLSASNSSSDARKPSCSWPPNAPRIVTTPSPSASALSAMPSPPPPGAPPPPWFGLFRQPVRIIAPAVAVHASATRRRLSPRIATPSSVCAKGVADSHPPIGTVQPDNYRCGGVPGPPGAVIELRPRRAQCSTASRRCPRCPTAPGRPVVERALGVPSAGLRPVAAAEQGAGDRGGVGGHLGERVAQVLVAELLLGDRGEQHRPPHQLLGERGGGAVGVARDLVEHVGAERQSAPVEREQRAPG